ncbi:hypothetical protein [Providencia rettgeri]|uniref:hypothetical protein n=1 Tax=Providencia rettgeri TaxID=587 RepID=UPI002360141E|nr:hypothetical protein [Providencia rettgeri]
MTEDIQPRSIETKFRKLLGTINPHLILIDVAVKELLCKNESGDINISRIEDVSKKYKNEKLKVKHLEFDETFLYVTQSHIAFIYSCLELFLKDYIALSKRIYDDERSFNLDGIDQLRRSIHHAHVNKINGKITHPKLNQKELSIYIDELDLKLLDYFRLVRNNNAHGRNQTNLWEDSFSESDLIKMRRKYKHEVNKEVELTVRDVILYSQVCQQVAHSICQKMLDIEKVAESLCTKYKHLINPRKDNAITNTLINNYLQDKGEVDRLRKKFNGWLA